MSAPAEQADECHDDGLTSYCTLPRGGWRIVALALAFALLLLVLGWTDSLPLVSVPIRELQAGYDLLDNASRLVFLLYLCALTAMWLVYLSSRRKFMAVQTLRQLLALNSVSWASTCDPADAETHVRETREKARTTITVAAILVAASALVISQINAIHVAMQAAEAPAIDAALLGWQRFLLAMGYICATGAFISLIVSVDALDCMFNHFSAGTSKRRDNPTTLARYFYRFTINPKYIGLFLLLTSVVFVLAYFNANVGSLALAIILTLGYAHWFPLGRLDDDGEPLLGGHSIGAWVIGVGLHAVPGYLLIKPFLSLS